MTEPDQIARIQRMLDESDKFHAEQRRKIAEDERSYERWRWIAPAVAIVTAIGSIVAATASVITLLRFAP